MMMGKTFEVREFSINRAAREITIVDAPGRLLLGRIVATYATQVIADVRIDGTWVAIWFTELVSAPSQYRVPEYLEYFPGESFQVLPVGFGSKWIRVGIQ